MLHIIRCSRNSHTLKGGKLGEENQHDLTTSETNGIEKCLSAMQVHGASGETPASPVVHRLHSGALPLLAVR